MPNVEIGQAHIALVHRAAWSISNAETQAEDLVSGGLVTLWECALSWDGTGSFEGYTYQLVKLRMIDQLRHDHGRSVARRRMTATFPLDGLADEDTGTVPGCLVDRSPGPEEVVLARERLTEVARALRLLPPHLHQAMVCTTVDENLTASAERLGYIDRWAMGSARTLARYCLRQAGFEPPVVRVVAQQAVA